MTIKHMRDWGFGLPFELPVLISGPCSAESFDQVMQSCVGVAEKGAHVLRAGIWKPRTRPNSFEGIGEKALPWIKAAGEKTGLPVTVEVATPKHVELALANSIDILWIGTRTTVSPFAVQEIVNALKGVDIPVMIKNPINPDVDLWIGAVERFLLAGIDKIAVIHRGFNVPNPEPYRNLPIWEIPMELMKRIPGIEMICDPSHICGNRTLLLEIAQKALDLNYRGLMIESHINPEIALSDAQQQITPAFLEEIISQLKGLFSFHLQH